MSLVEPKVMANSIMASIYEVLANGDETVPKSEDNFFSWFTPGICVGAKDLEFLTQGLTGVVKKPKGKELSPEELEQLRTQDTLGLYQQAESFARLVDCAVDVTTNTRDSFAQLSVMNNEGSLSERFDYILRMSQVMERVLDDETKRKLELAQAALVKTVTQKDWAGTETEVTVPSDLVRMYNEYMAAYQTAALDYNCRRIEALSAGNVQAVHYWTQNASILRNRVYAARAAWESTGRKSEYESITAFIAQAMARDMSLLKEQYKADFERARLAGLASGSDFLFCTLTPAAFMSAPQWPKFSFSSSEFRRASTSSYQLTSSTTKAGGLFFGVAGSAGSHSNVKRHSFSDVRFDSERFQLSFEITQTPVVYPWFKTAFLTSKLWRFDPSNPEAKHEMVSDGGSPPRGLIPAYITSLVFVRNLVLQFGNSSGLDQVRQAAESTSAEGGAVLALGSLNLAASHGLSGTSSSGSTGYSYDSETNTLTMSAPQIIGAKCHILPKSPDPDPSIKRWNA